MKKITVTRALQMPDLMRISRYEKVPEYGPRVLFFSGGTALTETARVLKKFTHNSIHLVTPFDSGGSSAVLRHAFGMPAIGDLRSRMMALADESISGHPEIFQLFAHRFSKEAEQSILLEKLNGMASGKDARVNAIKNPMRRLIRTQLQRFIDAMPAGFDLRGASIGNLILSAGYLENASQLEPVLFMFSKLVNVLGQVTTTLNDPLHLAVRLKSGKVIVGQHMITGKEVSALKSPIEDFFLVKGLEETEPVQVSLPKKKRKLISSADLICYPPGSFYSSLLANLLPRGVGRTIAANPCPKVYAPGLGVDPEKLGLDLDHSIFTLLDYLERDFENDFLANQVLSFVLIDSENAQGLKTQTKNKLKKLGIKVIDTRLVTPQSAPYYDPQLLVSALLSLT